MKSVLSRLVQTSLMVLAITSANAQISVTSEAQGNSDGVVHQDARVFNSTAAWVNAGYFASTEATAQKDEWDPQETEYHATTWFDQGISTDAQLHATGVMRQPYRGRYQNHVAANSLFDLRYSLTVENLSGQAINLVFGNSIHGRFGVRDQAGIFVNQNLDVSGFNFVSGSITDNVNGYSESGCFLGFVHSTPIIDPV